MSKYILTDMTSTHKHTHTHKKKNHEQISESCWKLIEFAHVMRSEGDDKLAMMVLSWVEMNPTHATRF
jgi:hypothetical protein